MKTLVLATSNQGKLSEFRALLSDLPIRLLSLEDVRAAPLYVEETEDTFEGNALLKAKVAAAKTGHFALADDSGLEVDALGGKPGVRSARFAGPFATDADNRRALLSALKACSQRVVTARFYCALALVNPYSPGHDITVSGYCDGTIVRTPQGTAGFGYDSLFRVDGMVRTMAELSEEEKHHVSHRGHAVANLIPFLLRGLAR